MTIAADSVSWWAWKSSFHSLKTIVFMIRPRTAKDCADIFKSGLTTSGVYTVVVNGKEDEVYCNMQVSLVLKENYQN